MEIETPEVKGVQDWFNSPGAKERYISSGGTESQWGEKLSKVNRALDTIKVVEQPFDIPDLYIGENAKYMPYYHTVIDHSKHNLQMTHEVTHGTDMADDPVMRSVMDEVINGHGTEKERNARYVRSYGEVYSRIMQIRKDAGISSDEKATPEHLRLYKDKQGPYETDPLFEHINDKGILRLMNELAYDDSGVISDVV